MLPHLHLLIVGGRRQLEDGRTHSPQKHDEEADGTGDEGQEQRDRIQGAAARRKRSAASPAALAEVAEDEEAHCQRKAAAYGGSECSRPPSPCKFVARGGKLMNQCFVII